MIYDTQTSNISFLQMSVTLKTENIKNNKFMLVLYNEELQGRDPFTETDPYYQSLMVDEISRNPWYFFREVARVPQEGSTEGIPFQLNVGNMAAAYCCFHNISHLLVLPRQVGKTVVEVMFSLWCFLFAATYCKETYLHKAQSGSVDNLRRLKDYKELLPRWLLQLVTTKNDKDNLETKSSEIRHNTIVALSSAANDSAADKLGRGSSTAMVYMDEFAFLERNKIVMDALIPAWATSSEVAKRNGAPYGIRITTTPNSLSLPQAAYCFNQIKQPAYQFANTFYDIPESEIEDFVAKNSSNDFVYIEFSWQECGKTKEWFDKQCRKIADTAIIKRELLCVWPESADGNVFTEDELEAIKYFCKKPVTRLMVNGYEIKFFEQIKPQKNYIISCDVAGGLSLDRSIMLFIDPEDFRVVGLFQNEKIGIDNFKELIREIMTMYFSHAILNIENNSYGLGIVDELSKDPYIMDRMLRETVERLGEKRISDGSIQKTKTKRVVYGTSTNSQSRKLMFEMLPAIVRDEPQVFACEEFYSELKNLVRNPRTGKVEARAGAHDDIIMAYLITRYSIAYGKCFRDVFHICSVPTPSNAKYDQGSVSEFYGNFGNFIDQVNAMDTVNTTGDMSDTEMIRYLKHLRALDSDEYNPYENPETQQQQRQNRLFSFISKLNDM